MPVPFENAVSKVATQVGEFVEASDRLVNLLATQPQGSEASVALHQASIDKAYDAYDKARAALLGLEDVSD